MRYLRVPAAGLLCGICQADIDDAVIDGATVFGSWAYMCPICHQAFGRGLGVGAGQRFERQADDRYLLTEGGRKSAPQTA